MIFFLLIFNEIEENIRNIEFNNEHVNGLISFTFVLYEIRDIYI